MAAKDQRKLAAAVMAASVLGVSILASICRPSKWGRPKVMRVPQTDPFSFTMLGKPWIAFEWGAEVIYATAYNLAGHGPVAAVPFALSPGERDVSQPGRGLIRSRPIR